MVWRSSMGLGHDDAEMVYTMLERIQQADADVSFDNMVNQPEWTCRIQAGFAPEFLRSKDLTYLIELAYNRLYQLGLVGDLI
jgi:hypothetical protein